MNPWDNDPVVSQADTSQQPWANDPVAKTTAGDIGSSAASGLAKDASYLVNPLEAVRQPANYVAGNLFTGAGALYQAAGGEMSPSTAEYLRNPIPESDTSKFIDLATGQMIKSATGADVNYQPQTPYGEATKVATESLPYVAGSGQGIINPLVRAGGIGAGSEAGKQVAKASGAGEQGQELGSVIGGLPGAMAPEIAEKMGNTATDSIGESSAANSTAKQAAKNEPFLQAKQRNINYAEGLNANAENLKETYGNIYDKAGEISQGITRNEPGIQKSVSSLLDDLKGDPAHNTEAGTSQAYRDLTSVKDSFDENGNIPLDSITTLQRRVNDLYSPDMSGTRKVIYNALNKQLKTATGNAMQDNPEWGAMMGSGNRLFANYKDTYVNDTKTNPIWSLDDKQNYEGAKATNADPYGAGINTETRDKLYNLPANVKNLAQYEAMLRKLPPEMHDQFTNDVVAATKEDAPSLSGKIYSAYKAAKGNPYYAVQTAKNVYTAMTKSDGSINPTVADAAPHVNDAINFYDNLSNKAYDAYQQRMAVNKSAPRLPAPNGPTIAMPNPTQALPAPPNFSVDKFGSASAPGGASYSQSRGAIDTSPSGAGSPSPMQYNPEEEYNETYSPRQQRIMSQGQVLQSVTDSPEGDALRSIASGKNTPPQSINNFKDIAPSNYPTSVARESVNHLNNEAQSLLQQGFSLQQIKELGYKRGGAIPTPAQIEAGNYKKKHINFQGLNISIENPKGSIRSGTDKDSKAWSVKMPASYGYIKGSIGADKEHVDCYIGNHSKSNRVYVVNQHHVHNGKWDEHKIMLGFESRDEALATYKAGFSDGKGKQRIGNVIRMSVAELKDWLKNGNTTKPAKEAA